MDALPPSPPMACLVVSAEKQKLPPLILEALENKEGGADGYRSRKNADGTFDHGRMQINTFWMDKLRTTFGYDSARITHDACYAYDAAAFILRYEINRAGGNFWVGVGRFHSPDPVRGMRYAYDVARRAEQIVARRGAFQQ